MEDKEPFVCEECGIILDSVFDYLEHSEVTPEFELELSQGIYLDLWHVFQTIHSLARAGDAGEVLDIVEAIGVTLYSSATGVLRQQMNEIVVENSIKDIDTKLKELLDGEANNDK